MPLKLDEFAAIEFAGKIYVAGGKNLDTGDYSNAIFVCMESDGNIRRSAYGFWKKKTYLPVTPQKVLLEKLGKYLYVLVNGIDIHVYDPKENIWTQVIRINQRMMYERH